MRFYLLYKENGLYDPVLDDQEPIYEPIETELADFDLPSDPTEVFRPIPDLLVPQIPTNDSLQDPLALKTPISDIQRDTRSLTASPFVLPTKPYRPFSTEPIVEVPPLEDPIILNPNYHDTFGQLGDGDINVKTKFKLPISEQYDPDFGKEKKTIKKEVKTQEETVMTHDEVKFMEQMKKDIDLDRIEDSVSNLKIDKTSSTNTKIDNIEQTASFIVDESISKAVTVAEEIKKEIEVEIKAANISKEHRSSKSETKSSQEHTVKEYSVSQQKEQLKEINESSKRKEEMIVKEDRKMTSSKQEFEETIAAGTVKRLSASFEREIEIKNKDVENIKVKDKFEEQSKVQVKEEKSTTKSASEKLKMERTADVKEAQSKTTTKSDTKQKMSTSRLLAEQRAYTIGLQTIPNIRGSIHSSYHYDLLLKTFFIHLTDVMVALSRFILAEPVLSKDEQAQDMGEKHFDETVTLHKSAVSSQKEVKVKTCEKTEDVKHETLNIKETVPVETEIILEKRKLSGLKMSQMTENKSEELTNKMSAVITEFENKIGAEDAVEEKIEMSNAIERAVSQGRDPIVWLAEEESKRSGETITVNKEYEKTTDVTQISKTIATETKVSETCETRERRHGSKHKEGRNTYVAIVESHVYTNKDAILDEQFSETSSIQSGETAIENIASERFESERCERTENIECEKVKQAKVVIEEPVREPEYIVEEAVVVKQKRKSQEVQNEDVEATIKIIKEISPPESDVVSQISDAEYSQSYTAETSEHQTSEFMSRSLQSTQIQESSLTATSVQANQQSLDKRALKMELKSNDLSRSSSFPSTIDTPTPATVPATPLTDEYVFRLEMPMPKSRGGTPFPEEPSPEKDLDDHEDFSIVKKKLIPHIETKIESIIYDPPLATPVEVKEVPSFQQNGVESYVNGDTGDELSKDEILEIERTSSLLASAIDETIKSIKEYKEQVGIDDTEQSSTEITTTTKFEDAININASEAATNYQQINEKVTEAPVYKGFVTEVKTTEFKDPISIGSDKLHEEWSNVTSQVDQNTATVNKLIENVSIVDRKDSLKSAIAEIKTFDSTEAKTDTFIATEAQGFKSVQFKPTATIDTNISTSGVISLASEETRAIQETNEIKTDSFSGIESLGFKSVEFKPTTTVDFTSKTSETETTQVKETMVREDIVKSISKSEVVQSSEVTADNLQGYKPVQFNPDEIQQAIYEQKLAALNRHVEQPRQLATPRNVIIDGETLGSHQGILSGLEQTIMDEEVAKELGKPGITEDKIAELISGESEMLREAHVMGLSRVISSHMTRPDDSSVDFKKIKPTIEKLKDSEVLKALNEEVTKNKEEKKKEERKWTTFLQKPERPMPRAKFGYHGWLPQFELPPQEQYKVKIVKQPKPKVAPDYKSENFETGLLPWEERAVNEPPPPPIEPEDPILVPEEGPQFLEAVDPLPESEVPDLEDTGIPLPPEKTEEDEIKEEQLEEVNLEEEEDEEAVELDLEKVVEETEQIVEEMEQNRLAEQMLSNVQSMVDPNAPLEQQLAQMRAQLAALAQLPCVIQQSLELVTKQLMSMSHQESTQVVCQSESSMQCTERQEETCEQEQAEVSQQEGAGDVTEVTEEKEPDVCPEEVERMRQEEQAMLEEQRRVAQQQKEHMEQEQLEHESRQVKQHPTPRVGKPKPVFGPLTPQERPLVLPGGRKWRKPKDAYNEQFIAETLTAQAEIIKGNAKGINFMKYEKPPVSLDHLKDSDVYKLVHNMEQGPMRRVEMLTPVIAESDYRERCRSVTPNVDSPMIL